MRAARGLMASPRNELNFLHRILSLKPLYKTDTVANGDSEFMDFESPGKATSQLDILGPARQATWD